MVDDNKPQQEPNPFPDGAYEHVRTAIKNPVSDLARSFHKKVEMQMQNTYETISSVLFDKIKAPGIASNPLIIDDVKGMLMQMSDARRKIDLTSSFVQAKDFQMLIALSDEPEKMSDTVKKAHAIRFNHTFDQYKVAVGSYAQTVHDMTKITDGTKELNEGHSAADIKQYIAFSKSISSKVKEHDKAWKTLDSDLQKLPSLEPEKTGENIEWRAHVLLNSGHPFSRNILN